MPLAFKIYLMRIELWQIHWEKNTQKHKLNSLIRGNFAAAGKNQGCLKETHKPDYGRKKFQQLSTIWLQDRSGSCFPFSAFWNLFLILVCMFMCMYGCVCVCMFCSLSVCLGEYSFPVLYFLAKQSRWCDLFVCPLYLTIFVCKKKKKTNNVILGIFFFNVEYYFFFYQNLG